MASRYGGDAATFPTITRGLVAPLSAVSFWTDQKVGVDGGTGGTQVTGLNIVGGASGVSTVTSRVDGSMPQFDDPAGHAFLWADAGGGERIKIFPDAGRLTLRVFNVRGYGAKGDGATDDTSVVAALITAIGTSDANVTGGIIFFPRGNYKLSTASFNLQNSDAARAASIWFVGEGELNTILNFTGNSGDGIIMAGVAGCGVRDLCVKGAAGHGIAVYGSNGHDATGAALSGGHASSWITVERVWSQSNGKSGVYVGGAYMTSLRSIWSSGNSRYGFEFGGYNTTLSCSTLWGYQNTLGGHNVNDTTYSSWRGCGADGNSGPGYTITNVQGLNFAGCGAEANQGEAINVQASTALASGMISPDVKGLTFTGFFSDGNGQSGNTVANLINATASNGKTLDVTLTGCGDVSPLAGAPSIIVGGGAVVHRQLCDLASTVTVNGASSAARTGVAAANVGCVPNSAWYYGSAGTPSTVTFSAVGKLHLTPFHLAVPATLFRIGCGVTVVGDSGSKVRLGVYSDVGGLPGALLVDAGQVAGDAVANPEITLGTPLVLPAGRYWLGAVGQSFTTTSPTVRSLTNCTDSSGAEAIGTLLGFGISGVAANSITGALPATLTIVGGLANTARVAVRFGS